MTDYVAQTQVEVRVRYYECDPMNVAHHAVYPVWLEMARTELLREHGLAYRTCEEQGIYFVVARMSLKYHRPARYDDVLRIIVKARPSAGVKVEHDYEIRRVTVAGDVEGSPGRMPGTLSGTLPGALPGAGAGAGAGADELLTTASTTLVCVDRMGKARPIPPGILERGPHENRG